MNELGSSQDIKISEAELDKCFEVLKALSGDPKLWAELGEERRVFLQKTCGELARPMRDDIRKRRNHIKKVKRENIISKERQARSQTGIRHARKADLFIAPAKLPLSKEKPIGNDSGKAKSKETDNEEKPELNSPRNCYVCKAKFTKLHHFYDSMCSECGDYNYEKRFQKEDLSGMTALITGARLKIGYQAALLMLRAGAVVVVTTRFPVDAAMRYSKEKDFEQWHDRLRIHGLDLRHIPSVELFCDYFTSRYKKLDLLINNAAQTVRRPPGFYSHLLRNESKSFDQVDKNVQELLSDFNACKNTINSYNNLESNFESNVNSYVDSLSNSVIASSDKEKEATRPEIVPAPLSKNWQDKSPGIGIRKSAMLSQIPYDHNELGENSFQASNPDRLSNDNGLENNTNRNLQERKAIFPQDELDVDQQQVDLRETNSWRLKLGQIQTAEMLELQLVNSVAPFVLCNRLVALMRKEYTGKKHIVNVSAMEGKFYRFTKAARHPHTNMAKAALNMLTHTSAGDLAKDGIFMNAVDTGWVTDEDPIKLSELKEKQHDFQPPLDIVDGAARVCDPFFSGIKTGKHLWGKFLKDYEQIDW